MEFYKYQGTGNDFVIMDDRKNIFPMEDSDLVHKLCDRKFGIGADGLILLQNDMQSDFRMIYYNADGKESSMCGNGGRCIVAFANYLGLIKNSCIFNAIDGLHEAKINNNQVELKMSDVNGIENSNGDWILNTGSPHYIRFVEDLKKIDIYNDGKSVRYNQRFSTEGINVNFIEVVKNNLIVGTYERGVENETLSCGTGVTAAALIYGHLNPGINDVAIQTKGGNLRVKFTTDGEGNFSNIWLCGPTELVFKGIISSSFKK